MFIRKVFLNSLIKFLPVFLFGFFVFFSASPVFSADAEVRAFTVSQKYGLAEATLGSGLNYHFFGSGLWLSDIIGGVLKIVMGILGAIFFALIVYGGLLWMTAHGNDTQVKKAQTVIYQAVVGLIVVLAAYAITVFVASFF